MTTNEPTKIANPSISVCRHGSHVSIAVFANAFECVRDFQEYPESDEARGVEEAKAWIRERTDAEPEIVYPTITSMRMTSRSGRRGR
jgi:hypothetical protein